MVIADRHISDLCHSFRRTLEATAIAVSLIAGGTLVSCGDSHDIIDDITEEPVYNGNIKAGFDITLSSGGTEEKGTRAPSEPEGGYDPGAGFENYIDIPDGDFRFLFFNEENRYVGSFDVIGVEPIYETTSSKRYHVAGEIKREIVESGPLKVLALANWGSYDYEASLQAGVTTIDDVCSQTFEFTPERMQLSADNTIPLYGVTNLSTLTPSSANRVDLGQINLLRAFAKIEVLRSKEGLEMEEGLEMVSVRLYRYNTAGYNAPKGVYRQDDYVHNDYNKDYVNTPTLVEGAGVVKEEELPFIKINDDRYIAYMPEYDNTSGTALPAEIHIRFKYMTSDDVVYFQDYSNGNRPFDILRNYWYRFTVRKNAVTVQVVPYSEVLLKPEFGLIKDPELVEINIDGLKYFYDRKTGQYYDESGIPVDNPYFSNQDPETGWSILRDHNNFFFCYLDNSTNKYYAPDRETEILNPYSSHDATNHNRLMFIDAKTSYLYYYHDETLSHIFANNGTTEIQNPFNLKDKKTNRIKYMSPDASKTYGYLDLDDMKWYGEDGKEISNPFPRN